MSGHEGCHPRVIERRRVVRCEHRSFEVDEGQCGTQHSCSSLACGNDEAGTVFGTNLRKRGDDQRTGGNGIDTGAQDAQCVAA
jgi:hypothetical protein